jgi:hypothetical protein
MGNAWPRHFTDSIFDYNDHYNEVEHQFLDPELEKLRRGLFDSAHELTSRLMTHSFASKGKAEWADVGVDFDRAQTEQDEERLRVLLQQRRRLLNDAGNEVVVAYDALVACATQKFVG